MLRPENESTEITFYRKKMKKEKILNQWNTNPYNSRDKKKSSLKTSQNILRYRK